MSLDTYLGPVFFWWPLLVPPDIAHRLEMVRMMLQDWSVTFSCFPTEGMHLLVIFIN